MTSDAADPAAEKRKTGLECVILAIGNDDRMIAQETDVLEVLGRLRRLKAS